MLTVPFVGLVLLTFVSVAAIPCNLLAWPLLRALAATRPQSRAPLLLLFVAAPWLLGAGVLLSSVADLFFGACDVGEMCLWNEDPTLVEHARALLVAPLLIALALAAVQLARTLLASRRAVAALAATSRPAHTATIRLIPSATALAFAARGRIFVSAALREALEPAQFSAVLAHERAHLRRSDGACQSIARLLSCTLLPPLRRRVLAALTLANEECCDADAASCVGRLETAAAILAAAKLAPAASLVMSPAFAESFVAHRVRTLLAPPTQPAPAAAVYATVIAALLSLFLLGDLLYYVAMLVLYPTSVA